MIPDPAGYLRTWSQEFSARADRVRHLIGSGHWLSDGHHKEALLRDFLGRYIPPPLEVSRGFIRGGATDSKVSSEIDIVVTDPYRHPVFLSEFGLTVCPPESVCAHIEVKSRYNTENLKKALNSIANTKRIIYERVESPDAWSCAFFYNMPDAPDSGTIERGLRSSISSVIEGNPAGDSISASYLLPTCIVCVQGFVTFLEPYDDYTRVRQFHAAELSAALAVLDLFSWLRTSISPGSRSELDELVADAGCEKPAVFDIPKEAPDE